MERLHKVVGVQLDDLRCALYGCDNYRVSGALEKLEHETILQDRASDRQPQREFLLVFFGWVLGMRELAEIYLEMTIDFR